MGGGVFLGSKRDFHSSNPATGEEGSGSIKTSQRAILVGFWFWFFHSTKRWRSLSVSRVGVVD
jgi:hypothetical protein